MFLGKAKLNICYSLKFFIAALLATVHLSIVQMASGSQVALLKSLTYI